MKRFLSLIIAIKEVISMKRFLSLIIAISMTMTMFCCVSSAETDTDNAGDVINYRADVHQLYSGFKDEVYKTTDFGEHEIRSDAYIGSPEEYRQYMEQFYDDEIANQFADSFTENVFENYVVFLNTLYQGCGTSPLYSVRDVRVSDEGTTVYGMWDYREDAAYADVVSILFVEVLIPKDEYISDNYSVSWEEKNDTSDNADKEITFDSAVEAIGFAEGLGDIGSAVITTTGELEKYLSAQGESLKNEYLKKYSDKFFENNVLFINLVYQSLDDTPHFTVNNVHLSGDGYKVYCKWDYPDGDLPCECTYLIVAVSISKDDYISGSMVDWIIDENKKRDHSAVITSVDKMNEYLEKYNYDISNSYYEANYDDEFFKDNVLFMNAYFFDYLDDAPMFTYDKELTYNNGIYCVNVPFCFSGGLNTGDPFYQVFGVPVPKSEYNGQEIHWVSSDAWWCNLAGLEIYQAFTGYTEEIYSKRDHSGTVASAEELEKYLLQYYDKDTAKTYLDKYGEEFFEEYYLIVNALSQGAGTQPLLKIDSVHDITPCKNTDGLERHYNVNAHWINPDYELPEVCSALLVCIPVKKEYNDIKAAVNWKYETVDIFTNSIYGDVDRDGKVSLRDSLEIQRSSIGLKKLDDRARGCADVNRDGKVSNADALEIHRYCINAKASPLIGAKINSDNTN